MTQPEDGPPSGYAWDNAWGEARRRLDLLEQSWDPGSLAYLRGVEPQPGWRCLDIGAGGGSITRWLCDAVGPGGTVVSVDLDTRFLALLDVPNLEVVEADVVTDGLPQGPFDLVHTRAVLMHIPARDRLLAEMVARLRAGGTLVLEEADFHSLQSAESPLYREFTRQFGEILHSQAGMDSTWGRGLASRLARLGLKELRCEASSTIYPGRSIEAEFYGVTFLQARDLLLAHGIEKEQFDELLAQLDD
ncbi:MAG TPA: methyltransferase domain-containing protein, partial [Acidimicrobiia bacterium]|nr:methyltransferase domain-containing protein [Acidimicrobiia bacterium]